MLQNEGICKGLTYTNISVHTFRYTPDRNRQPVISSLTRIDLTIIVVWPSTITIIIHTELLMAKIKSCIPAL